MYIQWIKNHIYFHHGVWSTKSGQSCHPFWRVHSRSQFVVAACRWMLWKQPSKGIPPKKLWKGSFCLLIECFFPRGSLCWLWKNACFQRVLLTHRLHHNFSGELLVWFQNVSNLFIIGWDIDFWGKGFRVENYSCARRFWRYSILTSLLFCFYFGMDPSSCGLWLHQGTMVHCTAVTQKGVLGFHMFGESIMHVCRTNRPVTNWWSWMNHYVITSTNNMGFHPDTWFEVARYAARHLQSRTLTVSHPLEGYPLLALPLRRFMPSIVSGLNSNCLAIESTILHGFELW